MEPKVCSKSLVYTRPSVSGEIMYFTLSILPFKSMKVVDHFDKHLRYILPVHYILENEKIAFCGVFAGSTVHAWRFIVFYSARLQLKSP